MASKYDPETRAKAVRLLLDHRNDYPSEWAAITAVSKRLGMTAETLRGWTGQQQVDDGQRGGVSSEAAAEIRALKRRNAELDRRIVKSRAGSTVWRRELCVCVVDDVRDVGAGDAVGAELSVQECDLVPQLTVFVVESRMCSCASVRRCRSEASDPRSIRAGADSAVSDMAVSRRSWSRSSGWA